MGNSKITRPCTAKDHFILNLYAALFRLFNHMHDTGELEDKIGSSGKFPFLEKYLSEIIKIVPEDMKWEEGIKFFEKELTDWENACPDHLPLVAFSRKSGFDHRSRMALMIAGLVEEDSRFGTVIAGLQQPLAHRRVCLETIERIMDERDGAHSISSQLLSSNVVEVMNPEEPRSEWVLRISPFLWDVIRGNIPAEPAPWCRYHPPADFPEFKDLKFNIDFRKKLENVHSLFKDSLADAFILRGMEGEPRLSVMGSVARSMDNGIIVINDAEHIDARNWKILGPLCIMMRAIPVIICDPGPGETVEIPEIKGTFPGIIMGIEGGVKGTRIERSVTLTIPQPDSAYRRRCWTDAFSGFQIEKEDGVDGLELIIERFHMPGDLIRRVSQIAKANAALLGRKTLKPEDVREAAGTLNHQLLDTLAFKLDAMGTWDDLVVGKGVESSLKELEIRCRNRDKLSEHMKSGYANNQGVRAIFTGMSGTGKTLAATILASRLGMDIYRVDLAAIVNKYIGETEKNLHRVLTRAQELDVILLFDEADALLGSRTEIRSANDRYANLETDYLLQKLENYQGIVIMTTNAPENIDKAFSRRMDMVVNFAAPQAGERLKIWGLHFNNKNNYLFNWDRIPGIDNVRLINFLNNYLNIDWIKTEKIEKINNGNTIRIYDENKNILLSLSNEKNAVNLKTDDRTDKFIAVAENGELNIYRNYHHKILPEELENIAQQCPMTGGQIRNASLQAALYALGDGGIVAKEHLIKGVENEYRKAGSLSPFKEDRKASSKGMKSFINFMKMKKIEPS